MVLTVMGTFELVLEQHASSLQDGNRLVFPRQHTFHLSRHGINESTFNLYSCRRIPQVPREASLVPTAVCLCVCVCGNDRAAAFALGTVHLCMTGAPAAFPPSHPLPSARHSKERSRQPDIPPRSSAPFPTRVIQYKRLAFPSQASFFFSPPPLLSWHVWLQEEHGEGGRRRDCCWFVFGAESLLT